MSDTLRNILSQNEHMRHATDIGRAKHSKMQNITIDERNTNGDSEIIEQILSHPNLVPFLVRNLKPRFQLQDISTVVLSVGASTE